MTAKTAKTRCTRPSIKDRAYQAICPNCGGTIPQREAGARGAAKTYCTENCKTESNNRAIKRGFAMARWAQAWRVDRGSGEIAKGAFEQLCNIIDGFNAEDAAAGRGRPDIWAAKMLIKQTNYIDRKKN